MIFLNPRITTTQLRMIVMMVMMVVLVVVVMLRTPLQHT